MEQYNFIDILITLVLAFIMLGVGLSIQIKDFKSIYANPLSLVIGLVSQIIVLPIIAFIIVFFANIPSEFKVGIMILAVSPGGTTSNFITYLVKGNTALSISMTSINSFINLLTIPIIVNAALYFFMQGDNSFTLPVLETILQIMFITILPVGIGVFIREIFSDFASKIQNPTKIITIILLAAAFSIKMFAKEDQGGAGMTLDYTMAILPHVVIFNILGLLIGYLVAKLMNRSTDDRFTIGIEVGLQNTTMAFLIAGTLLHNNLMTMPSLVYSMFSFWTTLIFGISLSYFYRNQKKNKVQLV